jgi:putative acetyltransferase
MTEITVRKFQPRDTSTLLSLYYNTVHEINIRDYSQQQVDAWASSPQKDLSYWEDRFVTSETIIAELDNTIAGFGNLKNGNSIDMLYVHKDFQRRGVASRLLKKLEKKLKRKGLQNSWVESSITARPFFEHFGYKATAENKKDHNNIEFITFAMEKKLDEKLTTDASQIQKKGAPWKEFFTNKAFDLFIVITGITIAFQLNNLKENNDRNALERFYLESMVDDLDLDIVEYEDNLNELVSDRKMVLASLAKIEKQENVTDSLGLLVFNLTWMKTFEGHRNTYSTIISSNGLNLLQDPAIRNMMLDHYRLYAAIGRFEDKYSDVVTRMHDYFSLQIDYNHVTKKIENVALIKNIQTSNLLGIAAFQLQHGIWRYEESLEKAKALKQSIHAYLNK